MHVILMLEKNKLKKYIIPQEVPLIEDQFVAEKIRTLSIITE